MPRDARVWKEGMVAGLLGAGGVAFWFLLVDLVGGGAFATPELLGRTLFSVLGKGIDWSPLRYVLAYTVVHVAAFVVIGTIVAWIVEVSQRTPPVLVGLLLFFVIFEAGFYGLTALLSARALLGELAWYQVGAANLVAAGLMGWYLWKRHPELAERMTRVLGGQV
ncbi:MAG: hypothetical protein WD771_10215 [Gemmatimonadaceae bacterium]